MLQGFLELDVERTRIELHRFDGIGSIATSWKLLKFGLNLIDFFLCNGLWDLILCEHDLDLFQLCRDGSKWNFFGKSTIRVFERLDLTRSEMFFHQLRRDGSNNNFSKKLFQDWRLGRQDFFIAFGHQASLLIPTSQMILAKLHIYRA